MILLTFKINKYCVDVNLNSQLCCHLRMNTNQINVDHLGLYNNNSWKHLMSLNEKDTVPSRVTHDTISTMGIVLWLRFLIVLFRKKSVKGYHSNCTINCLHGN